MLSSSSGKLWGVLELALPAHRLPQVAAWLRTRRGALRTLSLSLSPPAGAWPRDLHIQQRGFYVCSPALVAAVKLLFSSLQGAARLHSLRLAFVGQPPGGPDLLMDGAYIQLPHLRTLELCWYSGGASRLGADRPAAAHSGAVRRTGPRPTAPDSAPAPTGSVWRQCLPAAQCG